MKKFLNKNFIFWIGLLLLAFVADFVVTSGLMKTGDLWETGSDEFTTWNAIYSSSINADIIISGSSRAYRHINPFILDTILNLNSFNIGMIASTIDEQFVRYLTFEKYNPKPKYIIQDADYRTLWLSYASIDRFLPYIPFIENKNYLPSITIPNSYIPLYRYFKKNVFIIRGLQEFLNIKHYPELRKKGFYAHDSKWDGEAFNNILQGDSMIVKIEQEAINIFDLFLNHCKNNNINVILVYQPVYYKSTDFYKNLNEIIDIYHFYSKKYDIPFLNYSKDPICYDINYFTNATHLNLKGSELFSIKLAYDIDSLGIIKY